MPNHYEALGVDRDASTEAIKKAFKKKALECHPDKTHGKGLLERACLKEAFKNVNNAHEILSDLEQRAQYDKTLPPVPPPFQFPFPAYQNPGPPQSAWPQQAHESQQYYQSYPPPPGTQQEGFWSNPTGYGGSWNPFGFPNFTFPGGARFPPGTGPKPGPSTGSQYAPGTGLSNASGFGFGSGTESTWRKPYRTDPQSDSTRRRETAPPRKPGPRARSRSLDPAPSPPSEFDDFQGVHWTRAVSGSWDFSLRVSHRFSVVCEEPEVTCWMFGHDKVWITVYLRNRTSFRAWNQPRDVYLRLNKIPGQCERVDTLFKEFSNGDITLKIGLGLTSRRHAFGAKTWEFLFDPKIEKYPPMPPNPEDRPWARITFLRFQGLEQHGDTVIIADHPRLGQPDDAAMDPDVRGAEVCEVNADEQNIKMKAGTKSFVRTAVVGVNFLKESPREHSESSR